jgi:hypothetical protein
MDSTLQVIIGVVGCLVYLYLSWRTMRENYREEDMIAFGWVSLLVYLIGSRIAFVWSEPKLWLEFWIMNQGFVLGGYLLWLGLAWLVTSDRGWKFFAFGEDSLINLAWINLVFFVVSMQWKMIILLLIVCVVGWVFKGRYRSLWWYKSGKKGFLFLLVNMVFFVGFSVITANYFYLIMTLLSTVGLVMLGNERYSK